MRSASARSSGLRSLRQVGFASATDLLGTYAGGARDLAAWLRDAPLNTDRNLRLQYLAGDGVNAARADAIMRAILWAAAGRSTDGTFTGVPETLHRVQQAMRAAPQRQE